MNRRAGVRKSGVVTDDQILIHKTQAGQGAVDHVLSAFSARFFSACSLPSQ
jgi:hypothetical protein